MCLGVDYGLEKISTKNIFVIYFYSSCSECSVNQSENVYN